MQYLSDEWIEAASAAVAACEPTADPFAVSYTVVGGPQGDRAYTLDLGRASIEPGAAAEVGLRMEWHIAVAIATGRLSAQRAFLDGNLQIQGDAQALVGNSDGMAAIDALLAPLRSSTTY